MDEPNLEGNLEARSERAISTIVLGGGMASSFSESIAEGGRFLPPEPSKTRDVYEP